jgi:hypothetical protein
MRHLWGLAAPFAAFIAARATIFLLGSLLGLSGDVNRLFLASGDADRAARVSFAGHREQYSSSGAISGSRRVFSPPARSPRLSDSDANSLYGVSCAFCGAEIGHFGDVVALAAETLHASSRAVDRTLVADVVLFAGSRSKATTTASNSLFQQRMVSNGSQWALPGGPGTRVQFASDRVVRLRFEVFDAPVRLYQVWPGVFDSALARREPRLLLPLSQCPGALEVSSDGDDRSWPWFPRTPRRKTLGCAHCRRKVGWSFEARDAANSSAAPFCTLMFPWVKSVLRLEAADAELLTRDGI